MANTTNLDLEKPLGTDKALVARINSNMDKIDTFAGTTNQALSNLSSGKTDYLIIDATSYEYDAKTGWDYAYGQIPENFSGVVRINFNNYYRATCTVYKQNSSWGSIIGHVNSNHIPFFYNVHSGTSTLDELALKSELFAPMHFGDVPGNGSFDITLDSQSAYLIMMTGNNTPRMAMLMIRTTLSGMYIVELNRGSSVSYSNSGLVLTVNDSSTTAFPVWALKIY